MKIIPNINKNAFIKISGILLLLYIIVNGFITIATGEVGIVTRFGEVTGRTLNPGAHFIIPIVDQVITYNTKKINYETAPAEKQRASSADYKDFPVDTNTLDGQPVELDYTVRFSVDPIKAKWVAQNIGSEEDLVEKVVKTESRIWARNIPRKYEAEKLYTGEGSMLAQNEIFEALKPVFEKNGLLLDTVGIREIQFDEQYVNAIQAKQVEQVKIEIERNKAEQEKFKKEQRITAAEGQAREQELQRQTISNELLQKMLIEKWDGKYPNYLIIGDSEKFILPLPQGTN